MNQAQSNSSLLSQVVEFVSKVISPLANPVCQNDNSVHSSQVALERQSKLKSVCKFEQDSGPCIPEGRVARLGARRRSDGCVSDGSS